MKTLSVPNLPQDGSRPKYVEKFPQDKLSLSPRVVGDTKQQPSAPFIDSFF